MQTKTWTFTMADGRTFSGVDNDDAMQAIERVIRGVEPFEQLHDVSRDSFEAVTELPIAA